MSNTAPPAPPAPAPTPHFVPRPTRAAFTLLELLVVVTIIALLTSIGLAVGVKVTQSGKATASRNLIKALDSILTAYSEEKGSIPPAFVNLNIRDFGKPEDESYTLPLFDGRFEQGGVSSTDRFSKTADQGQPAVGLFLLWAKQESPQAAALIAGIDSRFIERRTMALYGWDSNGRFAPLEVDETSPALPIIIDAFGNPIRLGHPAFSGGAGDYYNGATRVTRPLVTMAPPNKGGVTFNTTPATRSFQPFAVGSLSNAFVGDSDEGTGVGQRPYFYSAGVDGNPGTRGDNIYGNAPTYPSDTKDIKND